MVLSLSPSVASRELKCSTNFEVLSLASALGCRARGKLLWRAAALSRCFRLCLIPSARQSCCFFGLLSVVSGLCTLRTLTIYFSFLQRFCHQAYQLLLFYPQLASKRISCRSTTQCTKLSASPPRSYYQPATSTAAREAIGESWSCRHDLDRRSSGTAWASKLFHGAEDHCVRVLCVHLEKNKNLYSEIGRTVRSWSCLFFTARQAVGWTRRLRGFTDD